jgi:replication protein CRI
MYDTAAISISYYYSPDRERLIAAGAIVKTHYLSDTPYKYILNQAEGSKMPRITITHNGWRGCWVIRVEVSIGEFLFGSNVHLPGEQDIKPFLEYLSRYVEEKTGIQFHAHLGRVTRLDCTKDYELTNGAVDYAIGLLNQVRVKKYNWCPINETVYFRNKGQIKDKTVKVYNKELQFRRSGGNTTDIGAALNILRLEVSLLDKKIVDLARSLGLEGHSAEEILTPLASAHVIAQAAARLGLEEILEAAQRLTPFDIRLLFSTYTDEKALTLIGKRWMESKFNKPLSEIEIISLSSKAQIRYEKDCGKVGFLSLE